MFEINIYGEIVPFQDGWVEEAGFFNLSSLNKQLTEADKKPILVRISSPGGDVDEGFAIYLALRRYATENKVEVHTRCDGRCDSIATVIFLAGDKRTVNEYISPFVHNAWTYSIGDAKEMHRVAMDLEAVNEKIALHYSEHTNLTVEEAKSLMDAETSISSKECLNIRFATEIEKVDKPKALKKFNSNININKNNKMSAKKKNKKSFFAKMERLLDGRSIKNLEVFTDAQEVLDFTDLDDTETPKVGDKANYNDKPADGSFMLADGITEYVFAEGALSEINVENEDDNIEALRAENEDLKSQLAASNLKNKDLKKDVKNLTTKITAFKALASEYKVDLDNESREDGKTKKKNNKKDFSKFEIKK